jgi:hypothetical protein
MRSLLLIAILSSTIMAGCEKKEEPACLDNGNYTGIFQRELVWGDSNTANIVMTFSSDNWSGSSDKTKYPALCNGTYRIE